MRRKIIMALATIVLLGAAPCFVFARNNGGGNAGGMSSSHMSAQGMANTNGPNSTDRDKGLERAEDRMSTKGLTNTKSANSTNQASKLNRSQTKGKKKGAAQNKEQAK